MFPKQISSNAALLCFTVTGQLIYVPFKGIILQI